LIERTAKCFDLKPKRLAADTAYGIGKFLGWLAGEKITPHIPVWDRSEREDGTYSRSDFKWHKQRGLYVCPNSKAENQRHHPRRQDAALSSLKT